ncbi:hypothetical protein JOY44_28440 (plasmid) [Phormidium sp. CLA17]|uniref:hypothetical protein n=1 Tax=Leptolyngbya sp. Cla-17 TaxID=2803751 RepID=UPI0014923006|nr:hypothetical protein [Leptolyngbya sp. Cla-17]MBM0745358.1 hypothetical protein [Leptolyngbya sp. Cla-17]
MTSQQIERPPKQSLRDQDTFDLQDWINQVRRQNQSRPDFEEWAIEVKAQMLRSLGKQVTP